MENIISDVLLNYNRVDLCHQPTPLEFMKRLTQILNGPKIWIKRDDCTGLATGGNKTRKLEFLIGEAIIKKSDVVVTQGAVQSNHVRQTAAASCKFGIDSYVLLERRVVNETQNYEKTGNVFFNKMFGTKIQFRPTGLDMNEEAKLLASKLREKGKKPYFIPGGGSNVVGSLGYVICAQELLDQIREYNINVQCIIVATGSTGTQAGLVAGFHALGSSIPIMGISVRQTEKNQIDAVYNLAVKTSSKFTNKNLGKEKIIVNDQYVGQGYGIPTKGTLKATSMLARSEGILLDLVYSGKAMDGLINMVENKQIKKDAGDVIFIHTGGSSSLFAYEKWFE